MTLQYLWRVLGYPVVGEKYFVCPPTKALRFRSCNNIWEQ